MAQVRTGAMVRNFAHSHLKGKPGHTATTTASPPTPRAPHPRLLSSTRGKVTPGSAAHFHGELTDKSSACRYPPYTSAEETRTSPGERW